MRDKHDVLILGGGLAGLTLALQLKGRRRELDVAVVERLRYPVPVAAHKVGESTVEIAAHYFGHVLGLRDHLHNDQLLKFGLRFFFGGHHPGPDLAAYDEVGPSDLLPVNSYQLDRGIFENYLAERARALGVTVIDGASVQKVDFSSNGAHHAAMVRSDSGQRTIDARWMVDASGRRGLIKRQLGLHKPTAHRNCAVWLRTSEPLDIDDWSDAPEWRNRCAHSRRLSTNHFMGTGYWVWLIPLSSGTTSVGFVFDPRFHALDDVSRFDGLLDWLDIHEPLVGRVMRAIPETVMDFRFLRGYPHGCREVFSADRWALSGEAGVFSDPFYSPGSDFIAIANTLITELIAGESAGKPQRARFYQQLYFSFFSSTLSLFTHQYAGFGDRDLMFVKTVWDYAYYWAVLAKLFFAGTLTDIAFLESAEADLLRGLRLNREVQKDFARIAARTRVSAPEGRFLDHCAVPWFYELKNQLVEDGEPSLSVRLSDNVAKLDLLAGGLRGLLATSLEERPMPSADCLLATLR
ncbi:MAG: NAD(P)/FAD-dependent oxidoreductase [Gammaproteobacteria bacterium]